MKSKLLILSLLAISYLSCTSLSQNGGESQVINSQDLTNFWEAIDSIQSTSDSVLQIQHLSHLFLDKASTGQKRMIEARRYTAEEYLHSINSNVEFWKSLRKSTTNLDKYNKELNEGIQKLKAIYPSIKPSTMYYTVGNFRSPGTGVDSVVLIGSEYALGDSSVNTSELPSRVQDYYKINPSNHLQFLAVHEYVHTQQKEMEHNLLSLALYEGIADFIAEKATNRKSPFKAFDYGPQHDEKIKARFQEDMFNPNSIYSWLWNSPNNEFKTSDLGYYVGHKIASLYYDKATDKQQVIKQLIELDYSNLEEVESMVDSTHYFDQKLTDLKTIFEQKRPTVVKIKEFENGTKNVNPTIKKITLLFSEPMNKENRGFDYGPLGEESVLGVQKIMGFSDDGMTFSYEVSMQPDKAYQTLITHRFLSENGYPLQPYLIDISTGK